MKISTYGTLLLISLWTVAVILIDLFLPINIIRVISGLPFVLLFPGYTLLLALFPEKEKTSGIERMTLSFGFSIVITALMGLILNYTPWGIRLESIIASVTLFILAMSVITWVRTGKLTPSERFEIAFRLPNSPWCGTKFEKVSFIILIIGGLIIISALGYAISRPMEGEIYTEFYILGPGGKAENYTKSIKLGNNEQLLVGIVNREDKETNYKVILAIDGISVTETDPIVLVPGDTYEKPIEFTPIKPGNNQKVDILLYRNGEEQPYSDLHIWIDVLR